MWPFSPSKFERLQQELAAVKSELASSAATEYGRAPEYTSATEPVMPTLVVREDTQRLVAPAPVIDKFPIIAGVGLTGAFISSAFRLCNQGWRYQYVDMLDELLENDPDARAVVRARILGVACGRYSIEPAKLPKDASDADRNLAQAVADQFALQFDNIPFLTQAMQKLAWADWYGVSGAEIKWEHPAAAEWNIAELSHIHSRRINYTNPYSWEAHIYDQGLVSSMVDGSPTNGVYGLPVSRYPAKFMIHTPSLSGQYPTRDGEGRYVAVYMLLKRMVTRATGQDFERVIRPWVLGYFNRAIKPGEEDPIASREDIASLSAALGALGAGSLNSAALPNTVKVELLRAAAAMSATDFLSYLNQSIAKGLLGQAFTTAPGANGNFATAEVADANTTKILEYSSNSLCATIREMLVRPWMSLNHPALHRAFCPRVVADVSKLPTAEVLVKLAKDITEMDGPVNLADIAARTSVALVAKDDDKTPRSRFLKAGDIGSNQPEELQQKAADAVAAASQAKSAQMQRAQESTESNGDKSSGKLVSLKPTGSGKSAPEA
jgi:phage gp29-like protein